MPEEKDDGQINFVKEAAKWQYNAIAMAGAAAFALVSGSALPILLGAGLELMYLSIVPNNSRFQRLVRSWKWEEEKRSYEVKLSAMFRELPPEMRTRYAHVSDVCEGIRANYGKLSATSQMFVKQMEEILRQMQVTAIPAVGEAFDPRHHEALGSVERADLPDQHIAEEIRRGYKIRERLLRPSMVRVVSNPKQTVE